MADSTDSKHNPVPEYYDRNESQLDPAPAYEEAWQASQQQQQQRQGPPAQQARPAAGYPAPTSSGAFPSPQEPFKWPSAAPMPSYAPGTASSFADRPIAIPQIQPSPQAPFLAAYPPALMTRGITPEAWHAFLRTLSAFLEGSVSDAAMRRASDHTAQYRNSPQAVGRQWAQHSKRVGQTIATRANNGNLVGTAVGVVGGAVSISLQGAFGAVRTVLGAPGYAVASYRGRNQSPLERAHAYAVCANAEWLHFLGLQANLLDTNQLAQLCGVYAGNFLQDASQRRGEPAGATLTHMTGYISALQVQQPNASLDVEPATLWLVVMQMS